MLTVTLCNYGALRDALREMFPYHTVSLHCLFLIADAMVHSYLLTSSVILSLLFNCCLHQSFICKVGIIASMSEDVMEIQ